MRAPISWSGVRFIVTLPVFPDLVDIPIKFLQRLLPALWAAIGLQAMRHDKDQGRYRQRHLNPVEFRYDAFHQIADELGFQVLALVPRCIHGVILTLSSKLV
jgi:hypothetical protein